MNFSFPELLAAAAIAAVPQAWALYALQMKAEDVSLAASRRSELGFSDHLVYEELLAPDVLLTTYGGIGAMYEVTWEDTSAIGDDEAIFHNAWKNDALMRLGPDWMAQNYAIPVPLPPLPVPAYATGNGQQVLSESHVEFASAARFRWKFLTAFVYQPQTEMNSKVNGLIFSGDTAIELDPETVRTTFEAKLQRVEGNLQRPGRPRRLGTHPHDPNRSEFLEAIAHVIYGDLQPIRQPNPFEPFRVNGILGSREVPRGGIMPMVGTKHLRVLSVYGLPTATEPNMMETYLRSPQAGSMYAQRMIFQDVKKAKSKLDFARRAWKGKGKSAASNITGMPGRVDRFAAMHEQKADDALVAADLELVAWTHYSAKVVFQNDDLEALLLAIEPIRKAFEGAGFTVYVETVNTLDGWFGSHPFNGFHDVREGQVHTMNIARMWTSSTRWPGRQTWTCKQCAPGIAPTIEGVTETGEAFYFDAHGNDSEQNFIQFGSPGCGKTTDLNAHSARYRRSPIHAVRALDKNYGQLVTCKFLGGNHYDDEKYWLFEGLDDGEIRRTLATFLVNLGRINGVPISSEQRTDVQRTLDSMLHYPVAHRSLSTFTNLLEPIDKERVLSKAIAQYAEGGVYNGRFDGIARDVPADDSYEVHELGALLGSKQDDVVAAPVMVWLLGLFERKLPGHCTIIPWEEAWTSIRSKVVAEIIAELLRTIRYRHGGIGFYTHSLGDIKDSPIGNLIFTTCPTRVIYPNRDAAGEFLEFFESLELSRAQINSIKNGRAKEVKFLSQGGNFGAYSTPYSPAELAIYGCTGMDEVSAAKRLMEQYPDDWDERHLRAYGCNREADRLRSLRRFKVTSHTAKREALV